jgi:predicted GIY-YIG superfamily endonuclease
MLRCNDKSYYVGHTDNLELRLGQHNEGRIPGYTFTRLPVEMVWCEQFPTRMEALEMERHVKGWSRVKKEALIRGDWKRIQQIAWGTNNPLPEHLK